MFKFSQCPLLCDIYILHILGSFFILELTKTLLRVKNKSNKSNHKKYNCETNTMVFLLSNKHLPLNEHCILPRATCTKYVIEDFLMVYRGKINKWTFDHFCHATESGRLSLKLIVINAIKSLTLYSQRNDRMFSNRMWSS